MEKNLPMYKVIERDLRLEILNGTLKQNDMIPSESELVSKYKVSRMTVRQAINNLLVDGYIYRHKGRGTFVTFNKKEIEDNEFKPAYSFARETVKPCEPIVTKVLLLKEDTSDEIIANGLKVDVGSKIFYVERIRHSNGIPLIYERLYLPKDLYPENLSKEVFEKSFHTYVQNELGFSIQDSDSSVEARAVSEKVANILNQTVGEPSLYMSSTSRLDNGRVFYYSRQYFHGNYFRFKHTFSK